MDENSACVQHIKLVIEESDIQNGALKILAVIRPYWEVEQVQFKLLTDGKTNKLVKCRPADAPETETVLVRVYGNKTDLLIDRRAETKNILLLNKYGLAPNLYATFENGLAYKYIPGVILNSKTVADPDVYRLVARKMAQLHKVKVEGEDNPSPCLWDILDKFLDLVPAVFSDTNKDKRFRKIGVPKARIREEIDKLRNAMENLDSPIVFAHNDLLLANVIYTKSENSVTFIDYEYAAFNYQAFDIGNHFTEFAGVDEVDYSNYPSRDLQLDWLKMYLTEYNGKCPSEKELELLYVQVNQFALMSHIMWGIWALIQTEHSYINFDFLGFSAARFNEYFEKKNIFLSLKISS